MIGKWYTMKNILIFTVILSPKYVALPLFAWIRLKSKESERRNITLKVTFLSELEDNLMLWIGVISPHNWNERIVSDNKCGSIKDNYKEIKGWNKIITSLVIVDNVFMSVNNNEHIREVKESIIARPFMTSFFFTNSISPKTNNVKTLLHILTFLE